MMAISPRTMAGWNGGPHGLRRCVPVTASGDEDERDADRVQEHGDLQHVPAVEAGAWKIAAGCDDFDRRAGRVESTLVSWSPVAVTTSAALAVRLPTLVSPLPVGLSTSAALAT